MSNDVDCLIRGGRIVSSQGIATADVAIADGSIVEVGPNLARSATREIDATGRYVLCGIIDAHVHFNEPGRTEWEGLATGSLALAAGGGTCFFDMPLNSEPPVLDAENFRRKRERAEKESCVDFALWGGLTPLNLDRLPELRDAGAIGVKAFMSASGIDSFPRADRSTLHAGMKRAAELGLLVAVHAEDDALAAYYTRRERLAGHSDAAAWLASRPVDVELTAIREALDLAGETRCRLHIVHVSSPEGVALVNDARRRGVDVTAETCPHYLILTADDVARIGAAAKCAPPIRDRHRRDGLWDAVRAGRIQTIGSDHSPAPAEMKTSADFFEIWGGIAGCQHGFALLLSACADTAERDFPVLTGAFSAHVAERFRLPRKGAITVGNDADITVVEIAGGHEITDSSLLTRHAISAYVGQTSRVRILHTLLRGQSIIANGVPVPAAPRGRLLKPSP